MKLLFCCEFYHPSVGGVQEVMRQLAERMAARGHDITVATSFLPERDSDRINGVTIASFRVSGNLARGLCGEVEAYRRFLVKGDFDAILIKAAQQWTFDATWEILDRIRGRKVFIPCGFSGLYEPLYADYFRRMPDILAAMDHLLFYAEDYRDIQFAREHGLSRYSIVPNGASEMEFTVPPDLAFRSRHGIPKDAFVYLTVGNLSGMKGHREILKAFNRLKAPSRQLTLLLNGNRIVSQEYGPTNADSGDVPPNAASLVPTGCTKAWCTAIVEALDRVARTWKDGGPGAAGTLVGAMAWRVVVKCFRLVGRLFRSPERELEYYIDRINRDPSGNKRVLLINLPRPEVVQAFLAADLFVFASNIEYSPLVLYEATAAGLPFVTVPVGNAAEIARWTGGGWVCPAPVDRLGYTRVHPKVLAQHMNRALGEPELLERLGQTGRASWQARFTWNVIADRYEAVLRGD